MINRLLVRAAIAASLLSLASAVFAAGPLLRRPDIHGERIVFSAEGDLWIASANGGTARRITTADGLETEPRFSPDGSLIAFSGSYDGGRDVYVMPAEGGAPKRLTWDPNGVRIAGWAPDGKTILFTSQRNNPEKRRRLWSVPATGGIPTLLPIPWVAHAAMAPDGKRVAYVPISAEWQHWKDYRAGQADDIWITDTTKKDFRRLTTFAGIDTTPTWAGNDIYFISERDGLANLYRLDPQSGAVTAATRYKDFECRYPESDGRRVIFQHGDGLAVYDPATNAARAVTVDLGSDQIHARTRRVSALDNLNFTAIGPTGKRLFLEARGQIISAPVEQGDWRVLASKDGTRSQYPSWSPDGEQIAFVSDRSGEEQVWLSPASGPGEPKQLTKDRKGPLGSITWSPDGKYLLTNDREMRVLLVDAKTGAITVVDQADRGGTYGSRNDSAVFSPDGKWIALPQPRAELEQRGVSLQHRHEIPHRAHLGRDELIQPHVRPGRQVPVLPSGPHVHSHRLRPQPVLRVRQDDGRVAHHPRSRHQIAVPPQERRGRQVRRQEGQGRGGQEGRGQEGYR